MSVDIPRTRLLDVCPSVHAPREMDGRTDGEPIHADRGGVWLFVGLL